MASDWVDFKLIRERVGIVDILTHYGLLDTVPASEQFKIHCPFHEDTRPSCNIHTGMQAFNCFGCHAHGGTLMFVRLKEGIATGNDLEDDRSAGRLVQEWFGIEPPTERPKRRAAPKKALAPPEQPAPDERMREEADKTHSREGESEADPEEINPVIGDDATWFPNRDLTHEYLTISRGLSPETIAHFRIGYHSGRGMMSGRIVIPIHTERGELVAYAGRFPGVPPEGEPKYKLPPKFKASHVVYNLHRVPPDERLVILVEGFFDVMRLYEKGMRHVIALMGTNLSLEQERLLKTTFPCDTHVLLAFDDDEAGHRCTDDCLLRLGRYFWVKTQTYEDL